MRVSILLFDGFTTLDAVGGYEVLANMPGVTVEFVAAEKGVIAADTRRLGLLAYRDFSEVQDTDILYVPGGPGARVLETHQPTLDYLRQLDATSSWTLGVCNGVTLLATAGLLKGLKAATNWFDQQRIANHGAEFVAARYHRDGKYVSGAGVSASIDMALFFAQQLAGDNVAKAIQLGIEYYPAPPFNERSPAEAPAPIRELIGQFESSGGKERLAARPPFEGTVAVAQPVSTA